MMPMLIHFAIVGIIFYSVLCRARHMDSTTKPLIRLQHGLLSSSALFSLVVPCDWAAVSVGVGVAAFLLLGSPRWRGSAPEGIARVKPKPAYFRKPWAG